MLESKIKESLPVSNVKESPLSEQEEEILKKAAGHYSHSQYEDSMKLCEQLIKQHPDNSAAYNQLGLCHYW
jgi:hypothetical protein